VRKGISFFIFAFASFFIFNHAFSNPTRVQQETFAQKIESQDGDICKVAQQHIKDPSITKLLIAHIETQENPLRYIAISFNNVFCIEYYGFVQGIFDAVIKKLEPNKKLIELARKQARVKTNTIIAEMFNSYLLGWEGFGW
jgi:hypothetical protein